MRDHCYYTGEYRDAAYSRCNLKYSVPKNIPILYHNGSNYDYHFIIKFKNIFHFKTHSLYSSNRKSGYKNW